MNQFKYTLPENGPTASKRFIPSGEIYEMHFHDYIEIELILSGKGEHIYNSDVYELVAGDAYIVTHHDLHAFRAIEDVELINLSFDINLLDAPLADALRYRANKKLYCSFTEKDRARFTKIHDLLVGELSARRDLSDIMIKSLISEIAVEIVRLSQGDESQAPSLYQRALEYIHSNFKSELSLGALADTLSVTPNYLGRVLSRELGISFNTYVHRLRLRHACSLLLFSNMPVRKIAAAAGYSSLEYFFAVFKKHFKMTPSEYRKSKAVALSQPDVDTNSILF